MVSVDVEVVIFEVSLNVFGFILKTGNLTLFKLVLKSKVLFEARHFLSGTNVFDVVFRLNVGNINLICL